MITLVESRRVSNEETIYEDWVSKKETISEEHVFKKESISEVPQTQTELLYNLKIFLLACVLPRLVPMRML